MGEVLRAALVGFGYAGRTFHAPLMAATPGWRLQTVVSSRPDEVGALWPGVAVVPEIDAALGDPAIDVVVIATPNDTHAPLALAAIAAGKHVVIDKPMALSLDEAREVVAAAEAAGVGLGVFHNRRWDNDFLTLRALIAEGRLGEVRHLVSHFDRFRPVPRDRWRENGGPGSGVWFDLGPHLVDQALVLFGLPSRINASLATLRPGGRATDWASVVLEYPDRRVTLQASMLVAGGSPRFVLHGTGGSVVIDGLDPQEGQLLAGMVPGVPGWGTDSRVAQLFDGQRPGEALALVPGDQRGFYRGFYAYLCAKAPHPVPPAEALAVMAVVEAAQAVANTGIHALPSMSEAEIATYHLH